MTRDDITEVMAKHRKKRIIQLSIAGVLGYMLIGGMVYNISYLHFPKCTNFENAYIVSSSNGMVSFLAGALWPLYIPWKLGESIIGSNQFCHHEELK